jgi:hypothetical protein
LSLDRFLPPVAVKTRQDPNLLVEEKCEDCGRKISFKEPKYRLRIKGKIAPYCQGCAKKYLPNKESEGEKTETSED